MARHSRTTIVTSFAVGCSLAAGSLCMLLAGLAGLVRVVDPWFWLPLLTASIGLAGSNYIYFKTYLKRP